MPYAQMFLEHMIVALLLDKVKTATSGIVGDRKRHAIYYMHIFTNLLVQQGGHREFVTISYRFRLHAALTFNTVVNCISSLIFASLGKGKVIAGLDRP